MPKNKILRLYFFLVNHEDIASHVSNMGTHFKNITTYIKQKIDLSNVKIINENQFSLTFEIENHKGISCYFNLINNLEQIILKINSLTKEQEIKFKFHAGILVKNQSNIFKTNIKEISSKLNLPFCLISYKVASLIMEQYKVFATDINKIWFFNQTEVSHSERLKNVFLDRKEENFLDSFFNSESEYDQFLKITGELGSGKTSLVKEIINRNQDVFKIVYLCGKLYSEKEFDIIIHLIHHLLESFLSDGSLSDAVSYIKKSALSNLNKSNLIFLIEKYFLNSQIQEQKIPYDKIVINLQVALHDAFKLAYNRTQKPIWIVVDDFHHISDNCGKILFSCFSALKEIHLKLAIIMRDDQQLLTSPQIESKTVNIGSLSKKDIERYLKLVFPHKNVSKKIVNYLHDVTEGNFLCLKEYLLYLLNDKSIYSQNSYLRIKNIKEINVPDNLLELFENKIRSFSQETQNVLKFIVILGDNFTKNDLDTLLYQLNYDVDEKSILKELIDAEIITKNGHFYSYKEDALLKDIYKNVPEQQKIIIHKILGDYYLGKGFENFSFKIFINYYRAKEYKLIFKHLPEIVKSLHTELNFNALVNTMRISRRLLENALKENPELYSIYYGLVLYKRYLSNPKTYTVYQNMLKKPWTEEYLPYYLKISYHLAKFFLKTRRLSKFLDLCLDSLKLAEEKGFQTEEIQFNILIANYYFTEEKLQEGSLYFEKIQTIINNNNTSLEKNTIYLETAGRYYFLTKEYNLALDFYKKLYDLNQERNDFTEVYKNLQVISHLAKFNKNYELAEESYKLLMIYAVELERSYKQPEIMLKLGVVYSYQNKYLNAINIIDNVLNSKEIRKNTDLKIRSYLELGEIHRSYGEQFSSIDTFEKAAKLAKYSKQKQIKYDAFIKAGLAQLFFKNYKKAIYYFKTSTTIYKRYYNIQLAKICLNIAYIGLGKLVDSNFLYAKEKLKNFNKEFTVEFIFNIYLTLIKVLYDNHHFTKIKQIESEAKPLLEDVYNYNKKTEYYQYINSIHKIAVKRKIATEIKKGLPVNTHKRIRKRTRKLI